MCTAAEKVSRVRAGETFSSCNTLGKCRSKAEIQSDASELVSDFKRPTLPYSSLAVTRQKGASGTRQLSVETSVNTKASRRLSAKSEVSDHVCRECGKSFRRPCDLTKHEKTHSRPWKCPHVDCKYSELGWPTEKELNRHVNDKHSAAPTLFRCLFPPCSYSSKRESNCKQHMEKAHGWKYVRSKTNSSKSGQRIPANSLPTPRSESRASSRSRTPLTPLQSHEYPNWQLLTSASVPTDPGAPPSGFPLMTKDFSSPPENPTFQPDWSSSNVVSSRDVALDETNDFVLFPSDQGLNPDQVSECHEQKMDECNPVRSPNRPEESGPSLGKAHSPPLSISEPPPSKSTPQKISRKRTRTGCLTCKKRRLKCDEARPICLNCVKRKRHCEGYNQRVVFKVPNTDWRLPQDERSSHSISAWMVDTYTPLVGSLSRWHPSTRGSEDSGYEKMRDGTATVDSAYATASAASSQDWPSVKSPSVQLNPIGEHSQRYSSPQKTQKIEVHSIEITPSSPPRGLKVLPARLGSDDNILMDVMASSEREFPSDTEMSGLSDESGPGVDLGSTGQILRSMRGPAVTRLLERLFSRLGSSIRTCHTNGQGESNVTSSSRADQRTDGSSSRQPRLSRKRKAEDYERDQGDDEEEGNIGSRPSTKNENQEPEKLLACPFSKFNPRKYRGCYKYTLRDISRVKQHLRRCHGIPKYCPSCYGIFSSEKARDDHIRGRNCQNLAPVDFDCVSEEQRKLLEQRVSKSKGTVENWYTIYEILFPGAPRPNSPYIEVVLSEQLRELQDFTASEGPQIVNELIQARIPAPLQPQESEVAAFTQTLFQDAVTALLERWDSNRSGSSSNERNFASATESEPSPQISRIPLPQQNQSLPDAASLNDADAILGMWDTAVNGGPLNERSFTSTTNSLPSPPQTAPVPLPQLSRPFATSGPQNGFQRQDVVHCIENPVNQVPLDLGLHDINNQIFTLSNPIPAAYANVSQNPGPSAPRMVHNLSNGSWQPPTPDSGYRSGSSGNPVRRPPAAPAPTSSPYMGFDGACDNLPGPEELIDPTLLWYPWVDKEKSS